MKTRHPHGLRILCLIVSGVLALVQSRFTYSNDSDDAIRSAVDECLKDPRHVIIVEKTDPQSRVPYRQMPDDLHFLQSLGSEWRTVRGDKVLLFTQSAQKPAVVDPLGTRIAVVFAKNEPLDSLLKRVGDSAETTLLLVQWGTEIAPMVSLEMRNPTLREMLAELARQVYRDLVKIDYVAFPGVPGFAILVHFEKFRANY